jgi:hypothetical protein
MSTETGIDVAALSAPLRARKPWHYTVGDVFALPPEQCAAAFGAMAATPQHTYLVEAGPGAAGWFEWVFDGDIHAGRDAALRSVPTAKTSCKWVPVGGGEPDGSFEPPPPWPLPNVHLSTPECSTQAELDERAPWVLRCPAAARVLRLVPTEGLDVRNALADRWKCNCPGGVLDSLVCDDRNGCPMCPECGFKLGGDGRPRFDLTLANRPVHPDWVRSVRQCAGAREAWLKDGRVDADLHGHRPNDGDRDRGFRTHVHDGRAVEDRREASGLDGVTHDEIADVDRRRFHPPKPRWPA